MLEAYGEGCCGLMLPVARCDTIVTGVLRTPYVGHRDIPPAPPPPPWLGRGWCVPQ